MNRWANFSGPDRQAAQRVGDRGPVHGRAKLSIVSQVLIGAVMAAVAVILRYLMPLDENALPSFTVIIAICIVTVAAGIWAGVTTMIVGGILTVRFILTPGSWDMGREEAIWLLGYLAVAVVILGTSELYGRSERRRHAVELARAEEEAEVQLLFASEMSHRMKNCLAIVQSIAVQSFGAETPEFLKFAGRLQALAQANALLSEHVKRPSASVRAVVEAAIQPFREANDAFRVSGPDIDLPSQDVVSLTMALHELATNAVKYGALADPKGRVSVTWEEPGGKLVLEWKEQDGPPVRRPTKDGFGSRLLRRAAMRADLQYEPDGVRCTIRER